VDTLRGARIPEKLAKKFAALARAKNPDAQRLAAERMAALSGKSAIPTLLSQLNGTDPTLRDAAMRSLAQLPEAATPLARELAGSTSEGNARRVAAALRSHAGRVPAAAIRELGAAARARLAKEGDPATHVLLEALARLAPEEHAAILFERAAGQRKAGKVREAFETLRALLQSAPRLDDEQRFFLGCLGLKVQGQSLLRAARSVDPVLMHFAQLVATGYPVAKQLGKQKDVELEDIYNLGFNFAESSDDNEQAFGEELLALVARRQPRGKLGVAAKNKLKLVARAS
jgi:hypothetical protein